MKTELEPKPLSVLSAIQLMRGEDEDKLFKDKYVIDKVCNNIFLLETPSYTYKIVANSYENATKKIIKNDEVLREVFCDVDRYEYDLEGKLVEKYGDSVISSLCDGANIDIELIRENLSETEQEEMLTFIIQCIIEGNTRTYLINLDECDNIE